MQRNRNRLVIAHLNINSLRSKFENLLDQVPDNIEILMILKTKLDDSFPVGQFLIKRYRSPYMLDRYSQEGGIVLFVMEDIPSKLLTIESSSLKG